MTEHAFDGLSWTEATLQDVSFNDGTLTFQMFDLVSQAPRSYELVKVQIEGVRALELRLSPHIQGEFLPSEYPIKFGALDDEARVFEGSLSKTELSNTSADGFWVTGQFTANQVSIVRTGFFNGEPGQA